MERIGKVVNISYDGSLLTRGDIIPRKIHIGSIVVDPSRNRVGKIKRVFGPVSQPYFLVRRGDVEQDDGMRFISLELFIIDDVKRPRSNAYRQKSGARRHNSNNAHKKRSNVQHNRGKTYGKKKR